VSFYDGIKAKAKALIGRFGLPLVFERKEETYTPGRGSVSVTDDISGVGVFDNYSAAEINGTTILSGDIRVYFVGDLPAVNDTIDYSGSTWRVVNVNRIAPGGTDVLYDVRIRK